LAELVIPVVWHAQQEGRGRYNSTAMLNDMLDLHRYRCEHFPGNPYMGHFEGAVVVVHGGREIGELDRLNKDIEKMKWVLLIFLGDEESSFPAEQVVHPRKKVWVQEPIPGRHDFANRYMINGYGHDRGKYLVQCEKDLDWFFGGQVTHWRRQACVDALQKIDHGGFLIETRGYHQGISLDEYYRTLCRAKIVACPSGPFSPDAARVWDALEAGAVPILDDLSPSRSQPGFWRHVLGKHPFPVVTQWSTLPELIPAVLQDWEMLATAAQHWWREYQYKFFQWLGEDLNELRG
jgi:hypothetical protein